MNGRHFQQHWFYNYFVHSFSPKVFFQSKNNLALNQPILRRITTYKIWWAKKLKSRKNICKLRKQLRQFDNTSTVNTHNTTKQRKKHSIFACVVSICNTMLSNWGKCFLDLLVLFLFACVFWSCSTLSSLGHCTNQTRNEVPIKWSTASWSSWGFGVLLKGTSVGVLKVERALYIHSPHLQFLPDRDSNSQPFDYESDSLTIRSRLPHERYTENALTHEFLPESAVYLVM